MVLAQGQHGMDHKWPAIDVHIHRVKAATGRVRDDGFWIAYASPAYAFPSFARAREGKPLLLVSTAHTSLHCKRVLPLAHDAQLSCKFARCHYTYVNLQTMRC